MNLNSKQKVVVYARSATYDSNIHSNVKSQIIQAKRYAQKFGLKLDGQYVDEGYSGMTLNRPAIGKLVSDAGLGLLDQVYVTSTSRIARNTELFDKITKELDEYGVKLIVIDTHKHSKK